MADLEIRREFAAVEAEGRGQKSEVGGQKSEVTVAPFGVPPSGGLLLLELRDQIAEVGGLPVSKRAREVWRWTCSPMPLPDFLIGAHAELMGWELATRDVEHFRIYFPAVEVIEPVAI